MTVCMSELILAIVVGKVSLFIINNRIDIDVLVVDQSFHTVLPDIISYDSENIYFATYRLYGSR